jgi:hypothetical protein
LLALGAGACLPVRHATLTIPFVSDHASTGRRQALIPLEELASRLSRFDATRLAFFVRGRIPEPYELVDADGDGRADHAHLTFDLGPHRDRLVVTCPGPPAPRRAVEADTAPLVALDLLQAY